MATYALFNLDQKIIHSFKAGSFADAQVVAQSVSTLFAMSITLKPHAAPPPDGQLAFGYVPSTQGTTVSCPSGVSCPAPTNS